ncbi:hypothetical protein EDEG_02588 [Edhazardia aedis USNM 41457]|uniref:Uncharacterized protein n=1 Tax=Edhazardia aedis (strain USNM 41457) TaxID=1003232 RepID=J9D5D3_EDHAE|nr:hypothetical protein EDEG_02588 [Edhazardia aedis USNM 41457]|eukprot:EJW03006.1 hypothetical protein EDEG_02588 [Edhazardia aedis USNM 41457]
MNLKYEYLQEKLRNTEKNIDWKQKRSHTFLNYNSRTKNTEESSGTKKISPELVEKIKNEIFKENESETNIQKTRNSRNKFLCRSKSVDIGECSYLNQEFEKLQCSIANKNPNITDPDSKQDFKQKVVIKNIIDHRKNHVVTGEVFKKSNSQEFYKFFGMKETSLDNKQQPNNNIYVAENKFDKDVFTEEKKLHLP